ncbi:MAG: AMP-binding protein, partial [Clostridia bacterium]|nr:AMP-binding protein [Clostridia bacterium]
GLCVGVHTPLVSGATCVLLPKYLPALCARTFRRLPIEFLPGVPTFFLKLIRSPEMAKADLSHLRGVFCGGDRLTPDAKHEIDAFLAAHGAKVAVRQGYGLTESASVITLSPEGAGGDDTIGLPLPNTQVRVVDPETLTDAEDGRAGELWLSGPTVMCGYLGDDALNAQTLIEENGVTWLRTGDLVRQDADGFLHFEQRIKRLIVTSGYNVYPSAVETALRETGLVEDAAVIGQPDDLRGQSIVAFVVADREKVTVAALADDLALRVPRYAIPHRFLFVEQLPLTVVGKIAYGRLEELARIDKTPRA